jgi:leader peptidase (prepilin peptidase) / N-methyltransferase
MTSAEMSREIDAPDSEAVSLRPNIALVGFGSAAIALASFVFLPLPDAAFSTLLGALMIAGADVDARTFLLPDLVTFGALAAGLAFAATTDGDGLWSNLFAAALKAAAVAAALLCLRFAYQWLRGQEGLGLGDVKLGAAIGAWLPLNLAPICFALAAMAALAFVIICRRDQLTNGALKLPFGAFLCPALWLVFFANALPN